MIACLAMPGVSVLPAICFRWAAEKEGSELCTLLSQTVKKLCCSQTGTA